MNTKNEVSAVATTKTPLVTTKKNSIPTKKAVLTTTKKVATTKLTPTTKKTVATTTKKTVTTPTTKKSVTSAAALKLTTTKFPVAVLYGIPLGITPKYPLTPMGPNTWTPYSLNINFTSETSTSIPELVITTVTTTAIPNTEPTATTLRKVSLETSSNKTNLELTENIPKVPVIGNGRRSTHRRRRTTTRKRWGQNHRHNNRGSD